jgi:hypothetical protein
VPCAGASLIFIQEKCSLIRPIKTENWVPHPFRVLCGKGGGA